MKPPRKKSKVPKGYQPFPIKLLQNENYPKDGEANKALRFTCHAVVQDDQHVTVSAPGDMDLLYQMGCYGTGSKSRHEPVFHNVIEDQDIGGIELHLSQISMERYSYSSTTKVGAESLPTPVTPQRFVDVYRSDNKTLNTLDVVHAVAVDYTYNDDRKYPELTEAKRQRMEIGGLTAVAESPCTNLTASVQNACDGEDEVAIEKMLPSTSQLDKWSCEDEPAAAAESSSVNLVASLQYPYDGGDGVDIEERMPSASQSDTWNRKDETPTTKSAQWSYDVWDASEADNNFWSSSGSFTKHSPPAARHSPCALNSPSVQHDTLMIQETQPEESFSKANLADDSVPHHDRRDSTGLSNFDDIDIKDDFSLSSDDYDSGPFKHINYSVDTFENKTIYYEDVEHLILEPFEAVFLKLAFNCLHMTEGKDNRVVDLEDLWHRCITADRSFLPRYAVYHHIRAKGWVPKDGLTYGCDFVVYKKGPKYYHSSVGVIVRCCHADSKEEMDEYNPRTLTWTKLMGLSRVINNVRKELMICYVLIPSDLTPEDLSSPQITLRKLSVCETLFSRKIPSRERDKAVPKEPVQDEREIYKSHRVQAV